MPHKRWLLYMLLIMWCVVAVGKSVATTPAAFYFIGAGARARGVGNAFVGVADDASAAYWNPAGLTQLKAPSLMLMDRITTLDTNYINVAGALPLRSAGALGVNFIYYGVDDIPIFDENARPGGNLSDKEGAVSLSYANSISNLSFGVSVKGILQMMDSSDDASTTVETRTRGAGIDIALLYQLSSRFQVGVIFHDKITMEDADDDALYSVEIPRSIISGVLYRLPIDEHRLHFMADVEQQQDQPLRLHVGMEAVFAKLLALRAGLNDVLVETRDTDIDFEDLFNATLNPTLGAGVMWSVGTTTISADYAASFEKIGIRHFVSIGTAF